MIHHVHDQNAPLQWALIGLVVGGHLLFTSLRRWKKAQIVKDTPVVPIASAPQGFIEIQGYTWPHKNVLTSPIDEKACVFYSIKLEHYRSNGKSGSWVKVFETVTGEPFHIVDATGAVLVMPNPGECTLNYKTIDVGRLGQTQKEKLFNLAGQSLPNWLSGRYRVIEGIITVGSPFYVLGDLASHGTENHTALQFPGARQFVRKISEPRNSSLLEFQKIDTNHDGVVSAEEWSAYCMGVAQTIIHSQSEARVNAVGQSTNSLSTSPILTELKCVGAITTTEQHKIYFADCHKAELEKRLTNFFPMKILGGALLVAASAAYFLYVTLQLHRL